ncbi:hypothetical protein G6F37_007478 [Rhizopus arrhizus]|nr:hypothetical protein G6F38_008156 [Rhizopus arrhizus]KAG1156583.1 hypothetical protein G6F37_007478 [Rhizopus arrhizus]
MSQLAIIRELLGKDQQPKSVKKANTLRFKMESIGMQLEEEDDDLHTCPSRTRPQWPRQIHPWWKPADRFEKPPYSYATLIAHAILSSKDGRLTLSDIYQWISEVYPYYKKGVKGWQNSIRHNLSLNKKWFVKLDRRPTQAHPGKGGYWTLRPMTEKLFVENLTLVGIPRHPETKEEGVASNIYITRPEDYKVKKTKSFLSAPRIRNRPVQESQEVPKTDPKSFVIRFDESGSKRIKNDRKRAVIGSVDEDRALKKMCTSEILQDFWMHEPERSLLLATEYNPLDSDLESQPILQGLQEAATVVSCHPHMKTIDLQYTNNNNVHHSNIFLDFALDPYLNFNLYAAQPPSDLLQDDECFMSSYWPDPFIATQCIDYF